MVICILNDIENVPCHVYFKSGYHDNDKALFLVSMTDAEYKKRILKGLIPFYSDSSIAIIVVDYMKHMDDIADEELMINLIIGNGEACNWYASNILKSRFELGEKAISKSGHESYYYAVDTIKERFLLGEKSIKESTYWDMYVDHFSIVC